MDHKQVEPGMVVLLKIRQWSGFGDSYSYEYSWVLVTEVHKGHNLALVSDPHIHGFYLSASPSGICVKGCGQHKLEDVIKAYYRKDCYSDDDDLIALGERDILTLLHTGITPAGCHVNLYGAELEDKCLELTLEEIEQQYGCHVKIKGRRDD